MKKTDFHIGQRVTHPEYGDGTVVETEARNLYCPIGIKFDFDNIVMWIPTYHRCTPIEPKYQYGDEVECSNQKDFTDLVIDGYYGFPNPNGGHWIKVKYGDQRSMMLMGYVRRPVKPEPPTPREEFEKATKCRSHDDIMKAGDRYVERTLDEARETWEKENPRLILPTWDDICQAPHEHGEDAVAWLGTDAGQQWLKERKEGGK